MSEITAYEIVLEGQFSNKLVVKEIKVYTTRQEAIEQAKETAKGKNHLKYEL